MTKKRVVLTVMAMIACGLLAACSKKEGGTAGTVISQDMKPGVSQESTAQEKDNKEDDKKESDDLQYEWPMEPWVMSYPKDVATQFSNTALFTYDELNYLVTATHSYDKKLADDLTENLEDLITSSLGTYDGFCASTPDTTGEWVDGKLITKLKDVEGEYVEINGLNVYKFTAQIKIEDSDRYGCVYGYSWRYLVPDTKDEDGIDKYSRGGREMQYIVVGVVPVVDQETYKPEMEELTDYIMYHTEMLTE